MLDKYGALTDKMVAAQTKGDMKLQAIYQDSAMAMVDPSCIVKKPVREVCCGGQVGGAQTAAGDQGETRGGGAEARARA